jgi:hypothetical protein
MRERGFIERRRAILRRSIKHPVTAQPLASSSFSAGARPARCSTAHIGHP